MFQHSTFASRHSFAIRHIRKHLQLSICRRSLQAFHYYIHLWCGNSLEQNTYFNYKWYKEMLVLFVHIKSMFGLLPSFNKLYGRQTIFIIRYLNVKVFCAVPYRCKHCQQPSQNTSRHIIHVLSRDCATSYCLIVRACINVYDEKCVLCC